MSRGDAARRKTGGAIVDFGTLDGLLFDLDGVITRTAVVHAEAWKTIFDEYLKKRATRTGEPFCPFDRDDDYREYVDGKLRYDGVQSFLASRGISLPWGRPDDPPDRETVCGLGNKKNQQFLVLVQKGVEVYDTTVQFVHRAKAQGLKIAVISASKNCATVLAAAGIAELFDVRVDGVESERLGLRGKPEPDIFLEAAQRLGVEPGRTAVVEDAIAGVQAGRRGKFSLVIGIDRANHASELRQNGADIVVSDLSKIAIERTESQVAKLPSALDDVDEILRSAKKRGLVVFLDYDGTLTPIVTRPEDARLSAEMRAVVSRLANHWKVAIVSGRDLDDVRERVDLQNLYYAGSHGFEIAGPSGLHREYGPAREYLDELDKAERALRDRLGGLAGAQVERKHFTIAIHYRRVNSSDLDRVAAAVDAVRQAHPRLRKTSGKKVFELQPDLDWNKGTALFWLLEAMKLNRSNVLSLYIGDDVTDEDAFTTLRREGIGIVVGNGRRLTAARYALADTGQVRDFLAALSAGEESGS